MDWNFPRRSGELPPIAKAPIQRKYAHLSCGVRGNDILFFKGIGLAWGGSKGPISLISIMPLSGPEEDKMTFLPRSSDVATGPQCYFQITTNRGNGKSFEGVALLLPSMRIF